RCPRSALSSAERGRAMRREGNSCKVRRPAGQLETRTGPTGSRKRKTILVRSGGNNLKECLFLSKGAWLVLLLEATWSRSWGTKSTLLRPTQPTVETVTTSGFGTKRRFVAAQHFGRFRTEADIIPIYE